MRLQLLELKSVMLRDGVPTVDFLDSNLVVDYSGVQVDRVFLVEERHLCRADLLSFDAFGSPNHVDVILKFNQITNPFRMEVDDIIMVPSLAAFDKYYRPSTNPSKSAVLDTKSLFIDPTRVSRKDENRIKQLEKIAARNRNGAKEVKPTSLLRAGESPFTLDGTVLRLAPNLSKG